MGLLTEKGVTLGTTKSSGGLLQQQGYKKITDVKPVTKVTPPTTQPISFAGKAPVSVLFNPVTSPIPSKTVTKPTTGVFPTLQTKLAEKPYVSPYPTEKPATISPAGETILKTVAKTGVSLLEQVTKGLDYTQDLIAKNLISKKQPTLAPVAKLNDKWLNWYTQKESKGELLTQKAQKFVDTLAKSDYVQNRPEWEALSLKEKLSKNNLGETVLNLVPSVLSSVALYAINPAVGFVTSASSTAQDVKEDAIKNGVDEKKAEKLALATGLTVGALDKIVPDDVFRNNEIKKLFLKDFMKNLVRRTVTEAGTEIAQEDIQMIAEQTYREISKDEKKTRQVMSALGGALGGAGFSILGDFANTTVQNDILQTPPTKKTTVEEIKFTNPKTLAEEIGNSEPGGVKSVDQLSKTLETKDDEIYRDRVEEYKQKIQNGEAIDPIVVNEKEEVLDGGHRLTAMKELGIKATETVVQKEKPVVEKLTKVTEKVETNEALLEEARKYKSAEEFIQSQNPIYHGTPNKFDKFDVSRSEGGATWFSADKDEILNGKSGAVQGAGQTLNIMERIPKPGLKLATPDMADKMFTDQLISEGYRGVKYPSYDGQPEWTKLWFPNEDTLTKSQLTDIYNQAKGLTPEVKTKVVEKVEERKIETIAKPIEYIEKQVETIKDIKSVKTTLSSIRNELDNAIAEAEGKSIVATEQRAGLDTKKIGELKRIASLSKEYRAGNWDILKTKHGNLVDYVVEDVQRLHPEMEYDEAVDFALNLPTKAEESARTPIIRELEKKQKKLSKYLELLKKRQDELKVKTDNELDKQWREILSAQEKLIKIVSVAREQLPLGEGKKKVSRLEARVNKISKQISNIDEETIDRLSLATYNQLNKKENISKAVKYARKNPEEALKVLTGEIEAPKGILRNAIYVAMQNEAIGDVELARKIASIGATRLGQEISILTEIDPNSPVKLMSDVIKIKEEAYNKRFGKQKKTDVTEKSVNELKKSVKKADRNDWNAFINSIQC